MGSKTKTKKEKKSSRPKGLTKDKERSHKDRKADRVSKKEKKEEKKRLKAQEAERKEREAREAKEAEERRLKAEAEAKRIAEAAAAAKAKADAEAAAKKSKKSKKKRARESSSESSSDDSSSGDSSSGSDSGSDSSSSNDDGSSSSGSSDGSDSGSKSGSSDGSDSGSKSSSGSKSGSDSSSSDDGSDSSSSDDDEDEQPAKKQKEEPKAKLEAISDDVRQNSRVYMGNCSFDIQDKDVHEHFDKFGKILAIDWITDRDTGKFYGTGFIQFSAPEEAKAAVSMDQTEILGRAMKVAVAQGKARTNSGGGGGGGPSRKYSDKPISEKPEGCNTVFLGGLPYEIDEDQTRAHFSDCGDIVNIRWVEKDGEFKGCGFVEFGGDASSAVDLAVQKNGSKLLTRYIRVDYAAPRRDRLSSTGGRH